MDRRRLSECTQTLASSSAVFLGDEPPRHAQEMEAHTVASGLSSGVCRTAGSLLGQTKCNPPFHYHPGLGTD